jgi:uracil-DNA glycosylase
MKLEAMFGKEWFQLMGPFLSSEEFKTLNKNLQNEIHKGYAITPSLDMVFRCFSECPLHRLHTVVLGMDPYPKLGVADGLAFSSRTSKSIPASLNHIYTAIDDDMFDRKNLTITDSFDLTRWAQQGILLMNVSLTTIVGHSGMHMHIWEPFIKFVLRRLNSSKDSLFIGILGKKASTLLPILNNPTYKIQVVEHPAAAAYGNREWAHCGLFKNMSEFQLKTNNIKINWQ